MARKAEDYPYAVVAERNGEHRVVSVRRVMQKARDDFDEFCAERPEWHVKLLRRGQSVVERLRRSKHTGEAE